MQALAWTFHTGHSTIHYVIHETCKAMWDVLAPLYLKTPGSAEEWLKISKGFDERWNFPHCLGSIDGKHVNIQAPARSDSLFFNYKKNFSVVLLATCDYKYKFKFVDIGAYGSQSDGGLLGNSVFGQKLENNTMNIPPEQVLPGDEAFPLKAYIMRPYPGQNLTTKKKSSITGFLEQGK
nr:unnamed protein product [Callosobruchus chinensis]